MFLKLFKLNVTLFITRAVQKLIAINRIQNKSLCLHNVGELLYPDPPTEES